MAKGKMTIIPVTGPVVTEELSETPQLEKIKAALDGGMLELVPEWNKYEGEKAVVFCDEEGKLKKLPYNYAATAMWYDALGRIQPFAKRDDWLVGPIVVITGDSELMSEL